MSSVWSDLVERNYYQTQRHFETYVSSRPKKLFVDFVVALDASPSRADTPAKFVHALEEANWWLKQNLPQDPTTWHPPSRLSLSLLSSENGLPDSVLTRYADVRHAPMDQPSLSRVLCQQSRLMH